MLYCACLDSCGSVAHCSSCCAGNQLTRCRPSAASWRTARVQALQCRHPCCCGMLQVGEFYETLGTDAVMLVQWAGLNPMGEGNPPRAGCPIANLRRTLHDLVEGAGLSVVGAKAACQAPQLPAQDACTIASLSRTLSDAVLRAYRTSVTTVRSKPLCIMWAAWLTTAIKAMLAHITHSCCVRGRLMPAATACNLESR